MQSTVTAALARCAMSRTEAPADLVAGFSSGCFGPATFIVTWAGTAAFDFGASASFGASIFFGASASFGSSTAFATGTATAFGGEASAIFTVSTGAGATLCASAAANLSLNIIEGDIVSARELCADGSDKAAIALLATGRTGRADAATDRLITCASTAAPFMDG